MSIDRFRELHEGPTFVIPNPWDAGSAKILHSLGFQALATTSAGHAHTLGRPDAARAVSRDEALDHASVLVAATPLPVNSDLERGYGDTPESVAETVRLAAAAGLAGCSIEDATGDTRDPIYDIGLATDRIAAGVEAARETGFVLTARAENLLYGITDMADTINRLQRFQEAGAEVLYAPGLRTAGAVRRVTESLDAWVNVLAHPNLSVTELADMGVSRISIGSGMSRAAFGALIAAGREILDRGTFTFASAAADFDEIEQMFGRP